MSSTLQRRKRFSPKNGEIILRASGNATADGERGLVDALRVLQSITDETVTVDTVVTDVNFYETIDIVDVIMIIRAIISDLPRNQKERNQMKTHFTKFVCLLLVLTLAIVPYIMPASAASGTTVVYLKDGGTGNGLTEGSALGSLTDAYDTLDLTKDCTVVICGAFTQKEYFVYGKDYSGSVTFTSLYGGKDYRTSGAAYNFEPARFVCFGETAFENMNFVALGTNLLVVGQHHPVTIGEGVTMKGDKMTGGTVAKAFAILGGYQNKQSDAPFESSEDVNITVLSGSKLYIVAFSRSILGTYTGTANIKIGGNADVSVLHGSAAYPDEIIVGNVNVEITDNANVNTFYGCTQNTTAGTFNLNWKSGTIGKWQWVCSSTPGKIITYKGDTTLVPSEAVKKQSNYGEIAANFDKIEAEGATQTIPEVKTDYGCAVGLHSLGLAQGYDTTGTNFGLTDKLTRVQAVVQIIRFLGVENTVKSGSYPHPFTDVPSWADNYVGYAYKNSITSGRSATSFDPNGVVDEAQFITLMLRAIGYSDAKGEFTWNSPFALANSVGMTAGETPAASFLRANAFRISWDTLFATAKNGSEVSDNLISAGAFAVSELDKAVQAALSAVESVKPSETTAPVVTTEPEAPVEEPTGYNVISVNDYLDKTKAGLLSQFVGFLSGYEFARNSDGTARVAMPDDWFDLCNGPYAEYNSKNPHTDKLLYNDETKLWEVWNDDDYSIDILNQYILRDTYSTYNTFVSKIIKDDWVAYNVYDMGGGHRTFGAYGLMKRYDYLPVFSGAAEFGNLYGVNGEPYIGNETLGMNAAGMPNVSIDLADTFGSATTDCDPLIWLKFFSAMYSLAYFEDDIPTLIAEAEKTMPVGCWQRDVIAQVFALKEKYPTDWRRAAVNAERYCYRTHYNLENYVGETSINCSFILIGLLYGGGDYYETCKIISLAGHGGDSTTPTGLGIVGVITGWNGMDESTKSVINEKVWQDGKGVVVNLPMGETSGYWMYCAGLPERLYMSDILKMYRTNFESILLENGGKIENGNYYIPKSRVKAVSTVFTEDFESGKLDGYTTVGTVKAANPGFTGEYSAQLNGNAYTDSSIYKTVSGLKVGSTYRMTAYISSAAKTTAVLFARVPGATESQTATVFDNQLYIKRTLVFTAKSATMEIGMYVPKGTSEFKYASIDDISVIRVAESPVTSTVKFNNPSSDNAYTGSTSLAVTGKQSKEVYLKLTFANATGATLNAPMSVNGEKYATIPFYKTGSEMLTNGCDAVYVPIILTGDTNTLTFDIGNGSLTIKKAELLTVADRF